MTLISSSTRRPCPARQVSRITLLIALALLQSMLAASAERIKRKPPTEIEAARIASDQAMSDGMLRQGDIIATDRGFVQFRGLASDGGFDFVPVPNPLTTTKRDAFGSPR